MSTERQVMQGGAAAGQYARCGPGRMRNKPGEMHKKGARMLRNFALAVLSAAALTVAMAAPALAQGPNQSNSITVTAPVSESITMSGQASFSFPATVPGGSQTVTAAEAYTVSTNDLLGYTLNLNTGSSQMVTIPTNATPIPNTALAVTETATAPQTIHFTATGGVHGQQDQRPHHRQRRCVQRKLDARRPCGHAVRELYPRLHLHRFCQLTCAHAR